MKRSMKLLGLAAIAALAAMAFAGAGTASAATELQFFQNGEPLAGNLTFDSEATSEEQVLETVGGNTVVCDTATNVGTIEGAQEGEVTVTFEVCSSSGIPCTSEGAENGNIVVTANTHLVWGVHEGGLVASILLFPSGEEFPPAEPEKAENISEFDCDSFFTRNRHVEVRGGVLGSVDPVEEGEHNQFTLTFDQENGMQESGKEWKECSSEEASTAHLETRVTVEGEQPGPWEESGEDTVDQITLDNEEEGEIRKVEC